MSGAITPSKVKELRRRKRKRSGKTSMGISRGWRPQSLTKTLRMEQRKTRAREGGSPMTSPLAVCALLALALSAPARSEPALLPETPVPVELVWCAE